MILVNESWVDRTMPSFELYNSLIAENVIEKDV